MAKLRMRWVVGAVALGLAGVGWYFESVDEEVKDRKESASLSPAPRPAVPALPDVAPAASAASPLETPPGVLLVGTQLDGAQPAAVFMWGGQSVTVPVGARIGSSVFVLRRVTSQGAWVAQGDGSAEREIILRSPKELAEILARERQDEGASRLPSELASRPRPSDPAAIQRAEDGTPLPDDMQVSARRRERSPTGPVGSP